MYPYIKVCYNANKKEGVSIAKTSEAMRKAIATYQSNQDEIKLRIPKGKKAELKEFAAAQEKSLQGWIIEVLEKSSGISIR